MERQAIVYYKQKEEGQRPRDKKEFGVFSTDRKEASVVGSGPRMRGMI